MKNPDRERRATEFLNGLPVQGRPAELPGPSGDEDGDAGALPAPAWLRHRGHSGGEKPPSPTVHRMRHDGPLTGPEQQAPCHILVYQGSGEEEVADCGGRYEG